MNNMTDQDLDVENVPTEVPAPTEYILVTDKTSKILQSGTYNELKKLAGLIRRGGGEVTIFKATKG